MTADRRSKLRGRRGPLALIRHLEPAEALEAAQAPDATEELAGLPVPGVAPAQSGDVLDALWDGAADVSRETSAEAPRPLRAAQVAKLEALTALWERQVRLEAPPDATMLYASAGSRKPPVPPARRSEPVQTSEPAPVAPAPDLGPAPAQSSPPGPAVNRGPGRRVSDWTSRHDPASIDYAVRKLLRSPVSVQDRLLELGPILDQGTTPPLDARTAAACTGMAAVAAANVLELSLRPPFTDREGVQLLGVDDARAAYTRAQDLDAVSGHDYAGTSVLAVMKAGQEAGWWSRYLWALGGTRDVAQVILQLGVAVVVGIPWGTGLEAPDTAGVITPTGLDGTGHALAVVGIKRAAPDGRPGPWFVLQQSRGPAEGVGGLVYLHHLHLGQLLRGVGEAAVPLTDWHVAGLGL